VEHKGERVKEVEFITQVDDIRGDFLIDKSFIVGSDNPNRTRICKIL
jgi:hypothetical protein